MRIMEFFNEFNIGDSVEEIKKERKLFSHLMLFLTASSLTSYFVTIGLQTIIYSYFPEYLYSSWLTYGFNYIFSLLTMLYFILFTVPMQKIKPAEMTKVTISGFLKLLCASIAIMFVGSVIGNSLSELIGIIFNTEMKNDVSELVSSTGTLEVVVFVVILGPVVEELIFRKLLIDRLSRYGTLFAVTISSVAFGVFHGNFYQFFYAAGIGMILGYMYCIFSKVRYSILLHMIINLLGSVAAVEISNNINTANTLIQSLISVYSLLYMAAVIFGLFVIVKGVRTSRVYNLDGILMKPFKILKYNVGVIVFILYCFLTFISKICF